MNRLPTKNGFVKTPHGQVYYACYGQGMPMVIVHGGPGLSMGYLQPQMLTLADRFELIFIDLRGTGKSYDNIISEETMTVASLVDDLHALKVALALDKFVLLGHSWGGFMAMAYALEHPDALSKLVLMNPIPATHKAQVAVVDEFKRRAASFMDDLSPMFSFAEFEKLSKEAIGALLRKWFSVYFYDPSLCHQLNTELEPLEAQAGFHMSRIIKTRLAHDEGLNLFAQGAIRVPTLLLSGDADIILPWTIDEVAQHIDDCQHIVFEHCGHFPYIEKPETCFAVIQRALV